jgi:hypothetical protein
MAIETGVDEWFGELVVSALTGFQTLSGLFFKLVLKSIQQRKIKLYSTCFHQLSLFFRNN